MKEINTNAFKRMKAQLDQQWKSEDISDEVYREAMRWLHMNKAKPAEKKTIKNNHKRFFR